MLAIISNILVISYVGNWYATLPQKPSQLDVITNYYVKPNYWNNDETPAFKSIDRPRVVVSLSTLPNRVHLLNKTLESLLNQTRKPDAIYLKLPKYSNTLHMPYPPYKCPYEQVTVLDTEDYGPLTKLLPAVIAERDLDTIIITVDDDHIYRTDLIEDLVFHAIRNPDAAVGSSGWSIMRPILGSGIARTYPSEKMLDQHQQGFLVDVLEGHGGIAYRRKFFDIPLLKRSPKECSDLEDLFISGYLATVPHAKRVTIGQPTIGSEQDVHNLHRDDNKQLMECLRAFEDYFGEWETINF